MKDKLTKTKLYLYKTLYYSFTPTKDGIYIYNCKNAMLALKISQSAVSQSLIKLEKLLNVDLYIRKGKDGSIAFLSSIGELLYKKVAKALEGITDAESIAKEKFTHGVLNIGIGDTVGKYYLMYDITDFIRENTQISISLFNPKTKQIVKMLQDGDVDVGIITNPIEHEDTDHLIIWPITTVRSIFVASSKYSAVYSQKGISIKDLASHPLLLLNDSCHTRIQLNNFFNKHKINVHPYVQSENEDLLLEMALMGTGIAFVSEKGAEQYIKSKKVFKIETKEAIPERKICLCYIDNKNRPRIDSFVNFIKDRYKESDSDTISD